MEDYKVKIQVFEGPMDLLLHLVKINEVDIQEIKIADIARQYLDYMRLMEKLDLELAGDFLVMAATLLNIKARALLPNPAEEEEEDEQEGDIMTAQALLKQLIEYRKFKEAAADLRGREERQAQIFFREVALPKIVVAEKDAEISVDLEKLLAAFTRVLRFVDARGIHMVGEEQFSLEDKITLFQRKLETETRIELDRVFMDCETKVEMIVCLLALLELCRQKAIRLGQGDAYEPIIVFKRVEEAGAPGAEPAPAPPEAEIVEMSPSGAIPLEDDEDDDEAYDDDDPEDRD